MAGGGRGGEGASFSRAPDERAARSSPAGRSGKAIAPAVHCPANDSFFFFSFLFCKGGVKAGEKMRFGGGVSGGTGIWRRDLEDDDRRTGCGNKHGDDHCQREGEDIGVKRRRRKRWRRTSPPSSSPASTPAPTPILVPGMMSAFIDFVKPFFNATSYVFTRQ